MLIDNYGIIKYKIIAVIYNRSMLMPGQSSILMALYGLLLIKDKFTSLITEALEWIANWGLISVPRKEIQTGQPF